MDAREAPGTGHRRQGMNAALALGLLLALTLLARLPGLQNRPLWYDEAFSILFAKTGLRSMIQGTLGATGSGAADVHPLLYYTLLSIWMRIFGSGVFAVRMLSVVCNLLTVLILWRMLRSMFDTRTAAVAGLLFAASPFQVQYGQEARMYALMNLWVVLCIWMIWRGLNRSGMLGWVLFGVSAAAAMYTHALSAVFLLPLALSPWLLHKKERLWRLALAVLLALVLYLPWGVHFPEQLRQVSGGYWIPGPDAATLLQTGLGMITGLPLEGAALAAGLFLALAIYAFALLEVLQVRREQTERQPEPAWLVFLAIASIGLLFAISLWRPVYLVRILLPAGSVLLFVFAWLWTRASVARSRQVVVLVLFAAAFTLGNAAHFAYRGFPYAPFEPLAETLRADARAGDVILHANKISMLPETYYAPDLEQHYLADPPGSGSDTLARATQRVLGLLAEPDPAAAVGSAPRVYFLVFRQELEDYADLGFELHPALAWLGSHYRSVESSAWGDLQLYIFEGRMEEAASVFEQGLQDG